VIVLKNPCYESVRRYLLEKYSKRHLDEIKYLAKAEWPSDSWLVNESMVPWNYMEFFRILELFFPGDNGLQCKQILECGCGPGVLSVFLAKRGALIKAVDISPGFVRIAKRLARGNDVEGFIEVKEGILENLPYPDESFDIIVGTRILHHVE
jgi:2-polyprenyl-3-methyl-5-hydroxy-6-metoxy-1,4-benzoquinol methylase